MAGYEYYIDPNQNSYYRRGSFLGHYIPAEHCVVSKKYGAIYDGKNYCPTYVIEIEGGIQPGFCDITLYCGYVSLKCTYKDKTLSGTSVYDNKTTTAYQNKVLAGYGIGCGKTRGQVVEGSSFTTN